MPKFRKKPIVVEAEQYRWRGHWPDGVRYDGKGNVVIDTLEGQLNVSDGDWIITGVEGEKYPCKPDIFEAIYEHI